MKHSLLLFAFFISSTSLFAASPSTPASTEDIKTWAQSREWRNLLHYQRHIFGFERSLLDGPGFFLSPQGRTDSAAELAATIAAMQPSSQEVSKHHLHPQCAFPARLSFLERRMHLQFTKVPCPKFDEFMAVFKDPQSVSVVFSSAYVNNPSSMFGHSFLKINSKKHSDLVDVGINYAALVAPDENGALFAFFGVFGGYRGSWSTENYYDKIKEYVQGESRDLWEYELQLTPEETRRLVAHLWELESNSYFQYYFFDENCSFQILAAIEAIKPEWNLTRHKLQLIPGESIKNLFSSPDIVKKVSVRPSLHRQVLQKYEALDSSERKDFFKAIKGDVPAGASPLTLETGMVYLDFLNIKKKGQLSPAEKTLQTQLLSMRAAQGPRPETQARLKPLEVETRPDLGHDDSSIHLAQSLRDRRDRYGYGSTTSLKAQIAYHDLMNNDLGFKRFSQINFPSIEAQYDSDLQTVRLDNFNLMDVVAIPPVNFLNQAFSWKVDMGLYTARDYGCLSCRHVYSEVGGGGAVNLWSDKSIAYFLVTGRGELYHHLDRGYRYGPGAELGALWAPTAQMKIRTIIKQFFDIDQSDRSQSLQTYILQSSFYPSRNTEVRATFNYLNPVSTSLWKQSTTTLEWIYFFN